MTSNPSPEPHLLITTPSGLFAFRIVTGPTTKNTTDRESGGRDEEIPTLSNRKDDAVMRRCKIEIYLHLPGLLYSPKYCTVLFRVIGGTDVASQVAGALVRFGAVRAGMGHYMYCGGSRGGEGVLCHPPPPTHRPGEHLQTPSKALP